MIFNWFSIISGVSELDDDGDDDDLVAAVTLLDNSIQNGWHETNLPTNMLYMRINISSSNNLRSSDDFCRY
jgi:inorganic pyrophosphatase